MSYASPVRDSTARHAVAVHEPAFQAYQVLHVVFAALPIVAGLDKFFHLLANWDGYLAPQVIDALPFSGHTWMYIVGVVEIVAGLIVAFRPRVGAYIVMLWLWAIVINLLLAGTFFDIALRDLALSFGALALARLSSHFDRLPRVG